MKTKLLSDRWSVTKTLVPVLFAPCLLFFGAGLCPTSAATVAYTDSAAYFAADGSQTLQDFNSSPISTVPGTSIRYPNLVVSCSGSDWCNSRFFGTASSSTDGLNVFVTSPSLLTFTFNSPVTSFGIYIAGLGTILPGSTNFSISNSNGFSSVLYSNYSGDPASTKFDLFAGLISDTKFTSVTLAGTEVGDGIFLDNLSYGHSPVVISTFSAALALSDPIVTPLPAALPLFASGLIGLGLLGWRRKRKAQAT